MSSVPRTHEAIERWHQGKVNIFEEMAKLETELNFAEAERVEWKAKFIQANKDYGFELRDPCGTIWDHAKKLQQERDLAEAERVEMAKQLQSEKEMHAACQNERDEWIARFHADEKLLKEVM
jgi:nitrogen fixation protein FixH